MGLNETLLCVKRFFFDLFCLHFFSIFCTVSPKCQRGGIFKKKRGKGFEFTKNKGLNELLSTFFLTFFAFFFSDFFVE